MVWLSGLCAAIAVLLWWPPQTVRELRTPVPELVAAAGCRCRSAWRQRSGFGSVARPDGGRGRRGRCWPWWPGRGSP
ncbi:MAG: hypothetical protein R2719_08300 [Micropruina sp.]